MDALTQESSFGVTIEANLKWFDVQKGFGFVVPVTGGDDAFLHARTLRDAGVEKLGQGARLLCRVERAPRGSKVLEVVRVLHRGFDAVSIEREIVSKVAGTVKFYNAGEEYGFIVPDDGSEDIFLHGRCLSAVGLDTLARDTRVSVIAKTTPKGRRVAVTLEIEESWKAELYYPASDEKAAA